MSSNYLFCKHSQIPTDCKTSKGIICCDAGLKDEDSENYKSNFNGYPISESTSNNNKKTDISPSQLFSTMLSDQHISRFYNPKATYLPVILLNK